LEGPEITLYLCGACEAAAAVFTVGWRVEDVPLFEIFEMVTYNKLQILIFEQGGQFVDDVIVKGK